MINDPLFDATTDVPALDQRSNKSHPKEKTSTSVSKLRGFLFAGFVFLSVACVGLIILSLLDELAFRRRVGAFDQRMKQFDGGFSTGRREVSRHVMAWTHDPAVTDAQMSAIAEILKEWQRGGWSPELSLDLSRTSVGDQGLKTLRELKTLEALYLKDTRVTATGVVDIRSAIPRVRIEWDNEEPSNPRHSGDLSAPSAGFSQRAGDLNVDPRPWKTHESISVSH